MPMGVYARTKEHNQHMSEAHKGKHLPEEQKRKMSTAHMGKSGEKNGNWKGGVTPLNHLIRNSLDMKLWHKAVLEKNNFTCQNCGQHGGELRVHHVNNFSEFPELRFAINNGITLCENCHREFHKQYGEYNNTREQLEEFLGGLDG